MDVSPSPPESMRENGHPAGAASGGIALVTVTYNSASVLQGLLDSLPAGLEGTPRFEVVVADNDSRDESVEMARRHPIGARVIEMGRNAGYSAGINAAVATVPDDMNVLVLNPDIRLHPGAVARLTECFRDATVGVAVPKMLHEDGTLALSLRREPSIASVWSEALIGGKFAARLGMGEMVDDPDLYRDGGSIEWATGAAVAVSAHARRVVGAWDESFFLYSEEVDYMERVRRAGLSVVYRPQSLVMHIGGDYQRSPFLSAMLTTNRIRYYRRHHGALATLVFRLGVIVGEALRVRKEPAHRAALQAALSPSIAN